MPRSNPNPRRILVLRFSALGDILMTVPVLTACALRHPDVEFEVVSRPFVGSVFSLLPSNVHFTGLNPRDYKGPRGLWRLFRTLKALKPTDVADLHDVLRTQFLRTCFRLSGLPVRHIHKDRCARRAFLKAKVKEQQTTGFQRYAAVFEALGLSCRLQDAPVPLLCAGVPKKERPSVGIAPFAAHRGKIYPLEQMERVVEQLTQRGIDVYVFGAGPEEKAVAGKWAQHYPHVHPVVGTLPSMKEELSLIASLHAMLTMDSGNMHLAALTATPVVSIWGATHPKGGFLGWRCTTDDIIEDSTLACRPCSIYGNKPCRFGDYRCLAALSPERVCAALLKHLPLP